MPPAYVRSIQEEILYEYAKLISRSVFGGKINYAFVSNRFKALTSGEATMSGTLREWQREHELPSECVFCKATNNLQTDHLIPRSRGGSDEADNLVLSCQACNASRGDQGIFQWLGLMEKDKLHRLVAGKYLKELYDLHAKRKSLQIAKEKIAGLCPECRNAETCVKWDSVHELTCLCLESIF